MHPTAAESGREALEMLAGAARAGRPFGLVLLDANMPEMDGFAVAAYIAEHPALGQSTVMMLTSSGASDERSRCEAVGISAYLVKPVYAADLRSAIARARQATAGAVADATRTTGTGGFRMTGRGAGIRVLLVEDNVVNQRVAAGLLRKRGHDVTVAQNGAEALARLETDGFDVVLMDLQMPVMGGLEATATIRAREQATGSHTRIVAMTAHAMHGDRERCLEAGMDDYLSKPIEPRRLFEVVEHPEARAAATVTADAGPVSFDEAALLERASGDTGLMADLVALFLDDCPPGSRPSTPPWRVGIPRGCAPPRTR